MPHRGQCLLRSTIMSRVRAFNHPRSESLHSFNLIGIVVSLDGMIQCVGYLESFCCNEQPWGLLTLFFFYLKYEVKYFETSNRMIKIYKRYICLSSGWLILKQRRRRIKRFFYLYFYLVFNQELRNLEEKQCKYLYLLEINTIEWKEEIISSKIKVLLL